MAGELPTGTAEPDKTEPVASHRSKSVMLRAERNDTIEITNVVKGGWEWPKRYTVLQRSETYYGTELRLNRADAETPENYRLTCPGPDTHLLLWKSVTDDDGFIQTWIKAAEVEAEIAETPQYDICDACGDPLKTLEHERLAMFGVCEKPHIDPNTSREAGE